MIKNCPNYGSVIILEENKCPYCGTSYFDLSSLDLMTTEPFYLKIKYGNIIITQLVKPDMSDFMVSSSADTVSAVNHLGENVISFTTNRTLKTNIGFIAIPEEGKKTLMTIETGDY